MSKDMEVVKFPFSNTYIYLMNCFPMFHHFISKAGAVNDRWHWVLHDHWVSKRNLLIEPHVMSKPRWNFFFSIKSTCKLIKFCIVNVELASCQVFRKRNFTSLELWLKCPKSFLAIIITTHSLTQRWNQNWKVIYLMLSLRVFIPPSKLFRFSLLWGNSIKFSLNIKHLNCRLRELCEVCWKRFYAYLEY